MSSQLWAVICGNIRDELDFKLTLTRIYELRNLNKVQHIILSTWKGEIDKYEGLRDQLKKMQIYIIENYPLSNDIENTATASVNFWRQSRQLLSALDFIPKNDFVLRLRTDRSLNYINQMDHLGVFENYKKEVKTIGLFPKVFKYQITVFGPKMVRLLHMIDFVLLGNNRDLYKILNFDFSELKLQKQLVANGQWFAYPFMSEFPILRDYMRFTHFVNRVKVLQKHVEVEKENFFLPNVDYKVYAIYLMILYSHFNIIYMGKIKKYNYENSHFYQLFSSTENNGVQYTSLGSSIRDANFLENILFGRLQYSTQYQKFLQYVGHLIAYGNDETFDLNFTEYHELIKLQKDNFYKNSDNLQWFKELRNPPINPKNMYQYNQPYDPEVLNFMPSASSDWNALTHTANLEKDVYKLWLQLDQPSVVITEKMLLPIARTGNEYAIFVLLDLYNEGKISHLNHDEIIRIVLFYLDIHIRRRTESLQTTRIIILLLQMAQENKIVLEKEHIMLQCVFDKFLPIAEIIEKQEISHFNILLEIAKQLQINKKQYPSQEFFIESYISLILKEEYSLEVINYFKQNFINDSMILSRKWVID